MQNSNYDSNITPITEIEIITECIRCVICSNNHSKEECPVVCNCGCERKEEYCPLIRQIDDDPVKYYKNI